MGRRWTADGGRSNHNWKRPVKLQGRLFKNGQMNTEEEAFSLVYKRLTRNTRVGNDDGRWTMNDDHRGDGDGKKWAERTKKKNPRCRCTQQFSQVCVTFLYSISQFLISN